MHPLWSVLTIIQDVLLECSGSQVMGVRKAHKHVSSLYCSFGFANLVVLFHTVKIQGIGMYKYLWHLDFVCRNAWDTSNVFVWCV